MKVSTTRFMKIRELTGRAISKSLYVAISTLSKLFPQRGTIYMMHSVGDDRHSFNISKEAFRLFIEKIHNKNVVKLEEWGSHSDFICLTFDDVADSFYYNAYPLLKQNNIPFTLFVSCSLLNQEKYITTEMLKDLASCDLCTVGSHGFQHIPFASLNEEEAKKDLIDSKKQIENIIGRDIKLYAFPHGTFYKCGYIRKHLVKDYYKYGFGTISTAITKPSLLKSYFLPRVNVTELFIKNFK